MDKINQVHAVDSKRVLSSPTLGFFFKIERGEIGKK